MTWKDVLANLMSLPDDVLNQPAQVFCYDPPQHGAIELRPVYAAGTVGEMMADDEVVRCNRDGGNNRDSFVLFADVCSYDEHGEMAYTENWDGTMTGVKTGVVVESPFPKEVADEVIRRTGGQ